MYVTEQDLVNSFKRLSSRFLRDVSNTKTDRTFLVEEFDSLNGIADLVLGTYRPRTKTDRLPVDINWITPLTSFNAGDVVSVDEFMENYTVARSTASKILHGYVKAGFLLQRGKGLFDVAKTYSPILETVISIEAKLKNWQRALQQAHRYKRFSNFSFVLLEEKYSNPAIKNLPLFEKMGIGLITMYEQTYTVHSIPYRQEIKPSEYFYRINEVAYSTVAKSSVCS